MNLSLKEIKAILKNHGISCQIIDCSVVVDEDGAEFDTSSTIAQLRAYLGY